MISDEFLRHDDLKAQIAVASCHNWITIIAADQEPYDDEKMKKIFGLFMVEIKQLSSAFGVTYLRTLQILEVLGAVKSCLLDLDDDAMVLEMFEFFFETVGPMAAPMSSNTC